MISLQKAWQKGTSPAANRTVRPVSECRMAFRAERALPVGACGTPPEQGIFGSVVAAFSICIKSVGCISAINFSWIVNFGGTVVPLSPNFVVAGGFWVKDSACPKSVKLLIQIVGKCRD